MKKVLIPIIFLIFFSSCEDRSFDPRNPNAEEFVQMLGDGEYKANYTDPLPQFRSYDISVLLQHSNNFKEISYFPSNPVSSYLPNPYRLGECLLWTIEAIRHSSPTAEQLTYPSLAPVLMLEEDLENSGSGRRLTEQELQEVYQLYEDWWAKKEDKTFQELQTIDPLAGSGYRWR